MLGPTRCALLVFILSTPVFAAAPATPFDARMREASAAYEDLEYEKALEALRQAGLAAESTQQKKFVALYQGIIYSEMGKLAEAREAYDVALRIDPDATLPVMVSPKVASVLDAERAKVKAELAAPKTSPQVPADESAATSPAAPGVTDKPSSGSVVPGIAVAAAGAVAAGVGAGFLIDANDSARRLQSETFSAADGIALRDHGKTAQTIGVIGVGVGAAAIAAGAAMAVLAGGESDGGLHARAFVLPGGGALVLSGTLP